MSEGDAHYNNFLLMLIITDYLLSPEITPDEVAYLKSTIADHHATFVTLYEAPIIPKMHYVVHMPSLVLR